MHTRPSIIIDSGCTPSRAAASATRTPACYSGQRAADLPNIFDTITR